MENLISGNGNIMTIQTEDNKKLNGYYSYIQYCPSALKIECVNIGAIFYSEELNYFAVKMTKDPKRMKLINEKITNHEIDLILKEFDLFTIVKNYLGFNFSVKDFNRIITQNGELMTGVKILELRWCRVNTNCEQMIENIYNDGVE